MAFKDTKVIWKLKDNIDMPYACKDDTTDSTVNAVEPTQIASGVHQNDSSIQQEATSSLVTSNNDTNIVSECIPQDTSDRAKISSHTGSENTLSSEQICVVPTDNLNLMSNIATATPIINGEAVNLNVDSSRLPRWRSLPYRLRQKRADIYINKNSSVDFVQSLCDYLIKRGLSVLEYDDSVHYLPSDILLLDKSDLVDAGIVICLQLGKREVYNKLKAEFGDRV